MFRPSCPFLVLLSAFRCAFGGELTEIPVLDDPVRAMVISPDGTAAGTCVATFFAVPECCGEAEASRGGVEAGRAKFGYRAEPLRKDRTVRTKQLAADQWDRLDIEERYLWRLADSEWLLVGTDAKSSSDQRGHDFARLQQWAKATEHFARIADANPDDGWARLRSADCAFMTDDARLYQKHAKAALNYLETHRDEKKVLLHGRLARTICLAPDVAEQYSLVEELAEATWKENHEFVDRTSLLFVQLQKGDHKKLFRLTNSLLPRREGRNQGVCLLFRAVALYHLDQVEAASEAFSEGMTALDGSLPPIGPGRDIGSEHFDWLVAAMAVHRAATPLALDKMNAALEENPDNVKLLMHRALLHRRWRRWAEAADDFHRAANLAPDVGKLEHAAVAALMADNPMRYHHWKGQLVELVEKPDKTQHAWRAARVAAIIPNSLTEGEALLEPVRSLAWRSPTRWHVVIAEPILLYRLQRYEKMVSALAELKTRGAQWEDESVTFLLEGLAHFHLGKTERARKALSTADQLFEANAQPAGIIKRVGAITPVEVRLLREELRKLLAKDVFERATAPAETEDEGAIP